MAPVAVTAAILMGLGFAPLEASGLSLIANTAPVAFGAAGFDVPAALLVASVRDGAVVRFGNQTFVSLQGNNRNRNPVSPGNRHVRRCPSNGCPIGAPSTTNARRPRGDLHR